MAFITGASGMLGTHIAYELLKKGEPVTALRRESTDLSAIKNTFLYYENDDNKLFESIEWVEGDILDSFFVDEIVSKHKQVYHAAAFVSFNKKDHSKIMDINVNGTLNIVESCTKHKSRLCFTSSIAALGRSETGGATTEKHYRDFDFKSSVYSKSKFLAEQEVWRGIAEGMDAVMVNPAVILGPGDWDKSSAQLIKTVANGLKFYTNGSNGYVDVRDVAKVEVMLMNSNITGERFILSAENVKYKKLFSTIASELGVKPPSILANKFLSNITWMVLGVVSVITRKTPLITKETAKSANSHFNYSSQKIIDTLDYNFISFEHSIKHAVDLFKNSKL